MNDCWDDITEEYRHIYTKKREGKETNENGNVIVEWSTWKCRCGGIRKDRYVYDNSGNVLSHDIEES